MALIGYNAEETLSRSHRMRAHIREGFARVKLFIDIMVGKQPMFLGEPIEIEEGKPQLNVNRPL